MLTKMLYIVMFVLRFTSQPIFCGAHNHIFKDTFLIVSCFRLNDVLAKPLNVPFISMAVMVHYKLNLLEKNSKCNLYFVGRVLKHIHF